MAANTHTLIAREKAWRLRVIGAWLISAVLICVFLLGFSKATPFDSCVLTAGIVVFTYVSAYCIRGKTSVGMLPLLLVSLGCVAWAVRAWGLAIVGIGATVFLLVNFWRMWSCYAFRKMPDELDAIIVLGCAIKDGLPSHTLICRLDRALELAKFYPRAVFVLSGGVCEEELSEASVMYDYLLAKGMQEERMLMEDESLNTEQNIQQSKALLKRHNSYGKLAIITSDYHLFRSLEIGREYDIELFPIPAKTPPLSSPIQWSREVLVIYERYLTRSR